VTPTSRSLRWILIADDDDLVRAMWSDALRAAGYRTVEARNGWEALDLMRSTVPHLVILDLHMPELSGDDVLKHLTERPLLAQIPVLIVSGFLETESPEDFGFNVVGVLAKPVRLTDLLRTVHRALDEGPTGRRLLQTLPVTG
jgi:two-component system cell cycle response regulator DivK